jgi:outer membrane murein-binding lipoprotein Lpp
VKLSTREAALLGIFLVFGGVFLTNHCFFQPLTAHKQQLAAENSNLTMELQTLENKTSKYQSMEVEEVKGSVDSQKMLEAVPQSAMISSTLNYLESSARETHVKLISIHNKENAPADAASKPADFTADLKEVIPIDFQIVASGSHFDLLSFVLKIENAPRIYIINGGKISLARIDKSSADITTLSNNPDMASNDKGMENAVPESSVYDKSKSVLNLDFTAYYHNPSLSGTSQP